MKEVEELYEKAMKINSEIIEIFSANFSQNKWELFYQKHKKAFLKHEFKPIESYTAEESINYTGELYPYIIALYLNDDKEVINKFKKLRLTNETLRWFTPIDTIIKELDRLNKIDGLTIDYYEILQACVYILQLKIVHSLQVDLGATNEVNKIIDTPISVKYMKDFIKRKKYNNSKNQIGKIHAGDGYYNLNLERVKSLINDEKLAEKFVIDNVSGNDHLYLLIINFSIKSDTLSKRQMQIELFPLLKVICKDNLMYTRKEYFESKQTNDCKDNKSNTEYDSYKASRVKKIIGKR